MCSPMVKTRTRRSDSIAGKSGLPSEIRESIFSRTLGRYGISGGFNAYKGILFKNADAVGDFIAKLPELSAIFERKSQKGLY